MNTRMRCLISIAAVGLIGLLGAGPMLTDRSILSPLRPFPEEKPYKLAGGPFKVETALFDWTDAKRGRVVPVKIYIPADAPTPAPLIVFSHGLGGSREGYAYLGSHWASHGLISLHIQHSGSDEEVWRDQTRPLQSMKRAAADPKNALYRAQDVRFVIDQMERLNREEGGFKNAVDLDKIGVAGHSFGAHTTLVAVGELFILPGGKEIGFADSRIKAAVPMSAPVPRKRETLDRAFGKIAVPSLHMTGTLDHSPIGETTAPDRRLPFDHIHGADQYLVVFEGGDHMIFSGRSRSAAAAGRGAKDALFQDLIRKSTTAFWDAYLRGDAAAKAWLADGGFADALGSNGTLEKKLKR